MMESDLGAVIVRYFLDLDAEVYQEVSWGGSRADLVAVTGPALHVVECKASFGLLVLHQAFDWRQYAHRVSIAVPHISAFGETICRELGIGAYTVRVGEGRVTELVRPRFQRRIPSAARLRKALCEEQKTYAAAGSADGRFWSPFKATCEAMRNAAAASPGLTLRQMVAAIKHHYYSDQNAASSLCQWIRRGKVPGIVLSNERPPACTWKANGSHRRHSSCWNKKKAEAPGEGPRLVLLELPVDHFTEQAALEKDVGGSGVVVLSHEVGEVTRTLRGKDLESDCDGIAVEPVGLAFIALAVANFNRAALAQRTQKLLNYGTAERPTPRRGANEEESCQSLRDAFRAVVQEDGQDCRARLAS
jgi:hypothetical protein